MPRCHAPITMTAACEQELAGLLAGGFDVVVDRLPGLFGQLEPDGMSSFSLTDGGAINGDPIRSHILDLEADDIAASELAVDGKIEHGKIACSALDLQLGPDRPDVLRPQRRFGAEQFALIPRVRLAPSWIAISSFCMVVLLYNRGRPACAVPLRSARLCLLSGNSSRAAATQAD